MSKQFLEEAIGWGLALWVVGYVLGIVLFGFLPPSMLGWTIMPIGIFVTLWVLWKKIKGKSFQGDILIAATWTFIAVVFDYLFLVMVFKPADGYYKLDVYLYYVLTFMLPLIAGRYKRKRSAYE